MSLARMATRSSKHTARQDLLDFCTRLDREAADARRRADTLEALYELARLALRDGHGLGVVSVGGEVDDAWVDPHIPEGRVYVLHTEGVAGMIRNEFMAGFNEYFGASQAQEGGEEIAFREIGPISQSSSAEPQR